MWENVGIHMSDFFFSGSHVAKLDEKGRFVLPQEMRFGLVEEGKCEFAIGLSLGGCLAIYRKSAMDKIVEKFKQYQHVAKFQKFFTLFFSTLFQTQCDKVGRISLPMTLKAAVGIKKEVVIAGVMDKIELWPQDVYEENLQAFLNSDVKDSEFLKISEEAFALLNEEDKPVEQTVESIINPIYTSSAK